jgi:hypothetical protein
MDLKELTALINQRMQDLTNEAKRNGKRVGLKQVLDEIQLDTSYYVSRGFQDGQTLEFNICNWYYQVSLNRQELILRARYGLEVKRFKGDRVKRVYNRFSREISDAIEENLRNLPF